MSGVNPVVLIQIILSMYQTAAEKKNGALINPRTFVFQKNNLIRIHNETDEEVKRRKSSLPYTTIWAAENALKKQLANALNGRCGKVWIDPKLERLAVPLQTATGNSGFGVLPTGSRIPIPEGKFIRAFTYWEKVNDIDLSAFALTEDGRQEEFSWRNMYNKQGEDITFSGDQTSGYNGGSEYLDINIDLFKRNHPDYRYVIFCNNVYSGINFSQCECKAGFMIREENPEMVPMWKGVRVSDNQAARRAGIFNPLTGSLLATFPQNSESENSDKVKPAIFDPKTVATSYKINAESTYAYLFAIDLKTREMVWLNLSRKGTTRIAGTTGMGWLNKYLSMADIFSLKDLYSLAGEIVDDPGDANILVTDNEEYMRKNFGPWSCEQEFVHSWDFEKMLNLLK